MSDNVYTPDAWVVLRIAYGDEVVYKVMGGWYGGYLGANEWRLNSGITSIDYEDGNWIFKGSSGSTYVCHESCERTTALMGSVIQGFLDAGAKIDVVPADEVDLEDVSA